MATTLKEAQQFATHLVRDKVLREKEWRHLAKWLAPHRGMFTGEDDRMFSTRRNPFAFLTTQIQCIQRGAAGITSGMTPRNASWFSLEFQDKKLAEISGARAWLDEVYNLMLITLRDGGYYQAIHACNTDLLWAGCFLLYAEKDTLNPIRFENVQIGSFTIALNEYQQLDAVCRTSIWTPARLVNTFGDKVLHPTTLKMLQDNPYDPIRVYQLVRKRNLRDSTKMDSKNMPYESLFWEQGGKNFLHVGGYEEMPFFFTSWNFGRNQYGTGPGDNALFDSQQLDELETRKLEALAKLTSPPVQASKNLKDIVRLGPNDINFVNANSTISPILDLNPISHSIQALQNEIEIVKNRLADTLQASIFMSMPLDQRPHDMSATEFMERKQEALQQLGPVMAAYEPNVLTPMLRRVQMTLDRAGLLPRPPESLRGVELATQTTFISPIANALRQNNLQAMQAAWQVVAQIAQIQPDALDKLDTDQMLDEFASGLGVPGGVMRSDEDVAKMRQQRQEQQMQMQTAQAQHQQAGNLMQNAKGIADALQKVQQMQEQHNASSTTI